MSNFDSYNRRVIMKNHYDKLRKVEKQKIKLRNNFNNYNSTNSEHERRKKMISNKSDIIRDYTFKRDNINLLLRLTEIQQGRQLSVTPASGKLSLIDHHSPGKLRSFNEIKGIKS